MDKSRKLFKDLSVSNDVSRNGFDLSHSVKFTSKCGELIPLTHRTLMFGDKIKIRVSGKSRTIPVVSPAFTRINEYFDFFFVPYRLLGKQIPNILAQNVDNPTTALSPTTSNVIGNRLPWVSFDKLVAGNVASQGVLSSLKRYKNSWGFNRAVLSAKLMNHLGYCYNNLDNMRALNDEADYTYTPFWALNPNVSILPFMAYQKIYYDFFRNTQWEDNQPYNYNVDYMTSDAGFVVPGTSNITYWSNPTMFDLRYANYPRDLFFGLLPDSQQGDPATVEVDMSSIGSSSVANLFDTTTGKRLTVGVVSNAPSATIKASDNSTIVSDDSLGTYVENIASQLKGSFSILDERKSRFLQKYKEIVGSGKKDYQNIVKKIFGVDIPDDLADHAIYIGGHQQVINIGEVDNTSLSGPQSALQRGKGLGKSQSEYIEYEAKEPGVIMCIYHCAPAIDYALNAFHFDAVKTHVDDFANPVFDKLGYQEFPIYFLDNSVGHYVNNTPFIGYTSRYFDYKTSVDMVLGDFRETKKSFVAPLTPQYLIEFNSQDGTTYGFDLNAQFFKVNPKILDVIFGIQANDYVISDQIMSSVNFEFHAVRNLDYIGLPY